MADKIRSLMEEMLPELQYLIKKEIISKEKGQEIIQEREKLEYALSRK